ncbi:putative (S)-N-methylcoclaurine 3'-hydroxylase isozyme 2 [Bidens hawaiensis]|uniref:putative (S)-N-methylcoclaurine 3'-hydroxylase isozyme 2 n=1 Tax=Bidens hawaiensis TaxID=980011 RepID=UPI00404AC61A
MDITTFLKDNTLLFPLLFLPTITFLLFVIKQTKLLSSKSIINLPPGPTPLPVIGNLHQVGDKPHVSTAILSRQYGPLISLRLGQNLLVVASSPEAAMGVLKTQDRFLSSRAGPAAFQQKDLLPHSLIWSECNQTWKNLRTICRSELFSAKALESQSRLRVEKVSQLVDFLRRKQGQAIDVEDVVFTTLLNTLSSIIFGKDMLQYADGDGTCDWLKESMHKVIEYGGHVKDLGSFYPMLERFDLHGTTRGAKKVVDKVHAYWETIIDERRAVVGSSTWSSDQAQSFLDRLLENGFTSNQIYEFVMERFVAGSNTTTSVVVWAMTELLRHKEVMSKVEEEMRNEIESDQISVSQLSQLTYLQSCIKETYRLHPPVPLLLPRIANETCEVMKYTIPKNTKVFVNLWAMGRDPKVWDEPLRCMPERFTNSKVDFKGQDFELLPFGSGRRICAGMPSGIKSVEYILATLIREFAWTLPNGDDPSKLDVQEKFGIAMKRENPLKVIFKQK